MRGVYLCRRGFTFVGVVLFSRRGFTLACVVFIYICEVIKAGVCCLCGRGISFVGVVLRL